YSTKPSGTSSFNSSSLKSPFVLLRTDRIWKYLSLSISPFSKDLYARFKMASEGLLRFFIAPSLASLAFSSSASLSYPLLDPSDKYKQNNQSNLFSHLAHTKVLCL